MCVCIHMHIHIYIILYIYIYIYTWVDEKSIQRLFQGILDGYFRGCSGLFREGFGRFLEEK